MRLNVVFWLFVLFLFLFFFNRRAFSGEAVLVSGGRSRLVLSMLWSLCSLQENRSLQGTLRSSLTKIPYFLFSALTSKKDSSKTILTGILITLQLLDSFPARGAS